MRILYNDSWKAIKVTGLLKKDSFRNVELYTGTAQIPQQPLLLLEGQGSNLWRCNPMSSSSRKRRKFVWHSVLIQCCTRRGTSESKAASSFARKVCRSRALVASIDCNVTIRGIWTWQMHTELRKGVMGLSWQPVLKTVSWDVMSCNLTAWQNLLYNPTASNSGTLKMETAASSETLVPICQNIQCHVTNVTRSYVFCCQF
jgi:hypothetical protein